MILRNCVTYEKGNRKSWKWQECRRAVPALQAVESADGGNSGKDEFGESGQDSASVEVLWESDSDCEG
ncbi:hypothetical protein FACS1894164_18020 [Spirochaetia bacterium]|nr:hypothetical protein FACS1894164_18020 [Spirochaetia bacterium]